MCNFWQPAGIVKFPAILSGHHPNLPVLDTAGRLLLIPWNLSAIHCKVRGLKGE